MSLTHTPPPRTSPSRALARSLLLEALALSTRVVTPRARYIRWTAERCCVVLRAFVRQQLRLPSQQEWRMARKNGLPSQWTVLKFFQSQNALVRAIGLEPNPHGVPVGTPHPVRRPRRPGCPYTADHLQAILTAFVARHGRLPTRKEWRTSGRHRLPDPGTIRRHYGSLAALYTAMGLVPPARPTGNQHTRTKEETPR